MHSAYVDSACRIKIDNTDEAIRQVPAVTDVGEGTQQNIEKTKKQHPNYVIH